MKKIFCAIFVFAVMMSTTAIVACQTASAHTNESVGSAVYVDDNGAEGTGYGSINEPTLWAPLAIEAKTGEQISEEPGEAFELTSDADVVHYSCNPDDAPTVNMEPNDDLGPGNWRGSYPVGMSSGGKF